MNQKKKLLVIAASLILSISCVFGYQYYKQHLPDTFINDLCQHIKTVRNSPGITYGDELPFEIGTINFTENEWNYSKSKDCIRLSEKYELNLKKGDGIFVGNIDYQYRIGIHGIDDKWTYSDWIDGSQGYILPSDGQCTIVIRSNGEIQEDLPLDSISCMLKIFNNHTEQARTHLFLDDATYTLGHASGGNSGLSPNDVPENSLRGVEYYASQGYWGVECDVRLTADGDWILCHDATVDRTTDHSGYVKDYTLEQLQTFHLQKKNVFSDYTMPSIYQWLDKCKECGIIPFIEIEYDSSIQEEHVKRLVDALTERGMEKDAAIICFNFEPLMWVKKYDRSILTFFLSHEFPALTGESINDQDLVNLMVYGNVGLLLNQNNLTNPLTEQHSNNAHSYGLFVGTWTSYPSHRAETIQMLQYHLNVCGSESCPDVMQLL